MSKTSKKRAIPEKVQGDKPRYVENIMKGDRETYVSGLAPKKAIIESSTGRVELSVKKYISDTGTDFAYKGIRYVFGQFNKLKTPNWVIGLEMAMVYAGVMFLIFSIMVPQLIFLGIINLVAAAMAKGSESMIKESYNLWFEGQSKPIPFLSHPALMLPQAELDENGKPTGKILNIDGATFDQAVKAHAFKEIGSRFGPKLTWNMLKWLIIIGVIAIVAYGIAHIAHLV